VCCSVLQCVAVCCSGLQWVAVYYNLTMGSTLRSSSVLQCVAVCCSVLQWVAVGCSVLQLDYGQHIAFVECYQLHTTSIYRSVCERHVYVCVSTCVCVCVHIPSRIYRVCCCVLQVAVCCSVLQCVAVYAYLF